MRGYISGLDGQIHYRAAGTRGPALILLHESPLSSRIYERVLPILARDLRVWAFDTPGYGMSDPLRTLPTIESYSKSLQAAIDKLGIGPFAIAGTHTGASIGLEMTATAANRVTHLVMSGVPSVVATDAPDLRSAAPRLRPDSRGVYLRRVWDRFELSWGEDTPPELLNVGVAATISNLAAYQLGYGAVLRFNPHPRLRRVRCPVLLLNATEDRFAAGDAVVQSIVPQAHVVHLSGMRGQIPWRRPRTYARRVVEFLKSGDGRNTPMLKSHS